MSWCCCLQLITLITRLKDSNMLSPDTGVQDLVSGKVASHQVERGIRFLPQVTKQCPSAACAREAPPSSTGPLSCGQGCKHTGGSLHLNLRVAEQCLERCWHRLHRSRNTACPCLQVHCSQAHLNPHLFPDQPEVSFMLQVGTGISAVHAHVSAAWYAPVYERLLCALLSCSTSSDPGTSRSSYKEYR